MNFRNKNGALAPTGTKLKKIKALPGTLADEVLTNGQILTNSTTNTYTGVNAFTGANTHTGAETHSGVETHSGAETHSGLEVFSNVSGIKTDAITEYTAGNGTNIKTHVISAGSATLAPTAAQSGSMIALAKADGVTVTLPACSTTNIGVYYKFKVAVSCTSVGYVINTTGTDVFLGGIYGTIANPADAVDMEFSTSTVNKTITLDATTKCGLIGGWLEVVCVSGTQWMVSGMTLGTGTIVSPFSN